MAPLSNLAKRIGKKIRCFWGGGCVNTGAQEEWGGVQWPTGGGTGEAAARSLTAARASQRATNSADS